ncbi:MAG: DinB family protein [Bacteroidetes bacterium]|nr:DinB family protein [Bacteroidota bacterium]
MLFKKPFNTLQTNTENIWYLLSKYDQQTLNTAQAPGKWSVMQHLVHLHKSERSFVVLLSRGIKNKVPLEGSRIKICFNSRIYKLYLNVGGKIKAPKVIEPSEEVFNLDDVKNDFLKTRSQLYQLMESVSEAQSKKFWVHHKYLKELRIADLLGFMIFHQNHHRKLFSVHLK